MIKLVSKHLIQTIGYLSISCTPLIFLSCGSDSNLNQDHLVFRYNEHAGINTLDPAFSRTLQDNSINNQLFNGLVQLDNVLNIKPCIAKNWTISEDAKTYTFNLRNDVYFHKHILFGKDSSRIVVAKDFEYSLNRLRDDKVAAPGSWVLYKVHDFKAINDTIFQIELKQPFPAFIGLLTMKYCSVVPKEIVEHYGSNFRSNPIGTGPFKFKRWEENIKLVLRRNEIATTIFSPLDRRPLSTVPA
jgi:peptide/nickel transport system substrate-binding protein